MDVFKTHKGIVSQYRKYIESFIHIKDERIRIEVEKALENGFLFPEPLVQFNPSFEKGESMDELCDSGLLHSEMKEVFRGYQLYRHQVEAIRIGVANKDFIVTSGTGSGKSLTYIGAIFNHILKQPEKKKGIKAIIVYPMNALINSQTEEFNKYKKNYESQRGEGTFPFSYQQYTGQEKQDMREKIKTDPPDILLTNYMMLEMVMTRSKESALREAIEGSLQFLVFDELHTYRGRQGADVAMLIRRIKSYANNPDIVCIGTSATMVSGNSLQEQKEAVAEVGERIFGKHFSTNQIVYEYLERQTAFLGVLPAPEVLRAAIAEPIRVDGPEGELKHHALAIWLEDKIALEELDGWLRRKRPSTFKEIVEELAEDSGEAAERCDEVIQELLKWAQGVNARIAHEHRAYLPYRIHQFISQTGSVYVTLEPMEKREIELKPGRYIRGRDLSIKKLFPVVFSRVSGHEFICVRMNLDEGVLEPRDFTDTFLEEDAEGEDFGYLVIPHGEEEIWKDQDIELLPDSWIEEKAAGIQVIKEYRRRIPRRVFFNKEGAFSEEKSGDKPMMGWYMPVKLLFDPTSGTFYDPKTNEGTKLMRLGNEGRSTATTITSFGVIKGLHLNGIPEKEQKLLSFTDNRQDAALQAGHFNDFIKVGRIRAAIYRALENAPEQQLDFSRLPNAIFEALNLSQEEFAKNPSDFPGPRSENENALKEYLMIRALYDLKRGWRVVLPNLEQCALLKVEYKYLKETVEAEEHWKDIPILNDCSPTERLQIVEDVLDYFRTSYAISYSELSRNRLYETQKRITEKLKAPWALGPKEKIDEPAYMRYETIDRRYRKRYTTSAGVLSGLGRYFKYVGKDHEGIELKGEKYNEFIKGLFELLVAAGYLEKETVPGGPGRAVDLFQLKVDMIRWRKGDEREAKEDRVRIISYKDVINTRPNLFFQEFYKQDFGAFKPIKGSEHTGQVESDDRIEREDEFRKGIISALFCSPTMELGIDISNLNVVHMRNVPPNPANYAQRSGRAGRSGQGALVFTYCSNFSPHDRHYFKHSKDMVAGSVMPPRIDLANQELLATHINALYLAELGTYDIENSIADLVDETQPSLPLKDKVKETLRMGHETRARAVYDSILQIIKDFKEELEQSAYWYSEDWARRVIDDVPNQLDQSLNRWRVLYRNAHAQLLKAQEVVRNHVYSADSKEHKDAIRLEIQAKRQITILKNSSKKLKSLSEFYPFRYFASEGFLPGYNFTKLPLRAYVGDQSYVDSGEFISRPRFIALYEFGPRNIIYHNGEKFSSDRMIILEAEQKIKKAKISLESGYFFMDEEYEREFCPVTNTSMNKPGKSDLITPLLPMSEIVARVRDRISCEEEERMSTGFDIQTYFSVPQGMDMTTSLDVKSGDDRLLRIYFIPAARLVKVNHKWRRSDKETRGFPMGMETGFWKRKKDIEDSLKDDYEGEPIKHVQLFTENWADALYIQPTKSLGLDPDGIVTLQYAIKRAIEVLYQVEPNEIGVIKMGQTELPNIMAYEAAEGSLGILSQMVKRNDEFHRVIQKAYEICYFKDGEDTRPDIGPASYDDLLSYYNQRDHDVINRFAIKDALEKVMACSIEIVKPHLYESYDEQFVQLVQESDPNSSTEQVFLKYLKKNGLRLPDKAQVSLKQDFGLYVQPDFFYEPNIYVFCDGKPHDEEEVQRKDKLQRRAMRDASLRVITWHYREPLEELIERYKDVFIKVK